MAIIDHAWRLQWVTETVPGEDALWRLHCAKKTAGDISAVHAAMEAFYSTIATDIDHPLAVSTLIETRILEWVPSQNRFSQLSANPAVGLSIAGEALPMQIAMVTSLTADVPVGEQRQSYANRFYLGPITTTALSSVSTWKNANMTNVLNAVQTLNDDLELIANDPAVTFGGGIAIASEKKLEAYEATLCSVGNVPDTQRRRRRNLAESRLSQLIN